MVTLHDVLGKFKKEERPSVAAWCAVADDTRREPEITVAEIVRAGLAINDLHGDIYPKYFKNHMTEGETEARKYAHNLAELGSSGLYSLVFFLRESHRSLGDRLLGELGAKPAAIFLPDQL